jgi:hypothetical protein
MRRGAAFPVRIHGVQRSIQAIRQQQSRPARNQRLTGTR